MINIALQSIRRPVSWMVLACLAILVFALAACGGDSGSTASSSSSNASTTNSSANSSNGAKMSVMTVHVKESKDASGKDVYAFDQPTIEVKKGDTITIQNQSDELQDIDAGDAQKAGVDAAIPINQSSTMTFNTPGTFNLKSEKGATITVSVK